MLEAPPPILTTPTLREADMAAPIASKICAACKIERDIFLFGRCGTKGYRRNHCNSCRSKQSSLYFKTGRGKRVRSESDRWRRIKKSYGLSREDYNRLLQKQNMTCGICGSPDPGRITTFVVDHCHETHRVRGLLCLNCNSGLGLLGDNLAGIDKAANYLRSAQD